MLQSFFLSFCVTDSNSSFVLTGLGKKKKTIQRAPERHKTSGVENLKILKLVCSEVILESSQQSDSNTFLVEKAANSEIQLRQVRWNTYTVEPG